MKRERYWIEKLKATLNQYIPSRTKHERYENNKDKVQLQNKIKYKLNKEAILAHHKGYYEKNKEAIAKQQKEKREENPEINKQRCKSYYTKHKDVLKIKKKAYAETHKESNQQYKKDWYELNKEKIHKTNSTKCLCECGVTYSNSNKARHQKTKTHQNYVKMLNQFNEIITMHEGFKKRFAELTK